MTAPAEIGRPKIHKLEMDLPLIISRQGVANEGDKAHVVFIVVEIASVEHDYGDAGCFVRDLHGRLGDDPLVV